MPSADAQAPVILTINGGSSSIKFALFDAIDPPKMILTGELERVGQPGTTMSAKGLGDDVKDRPINAEDHGQAANGLIEWLRGRLRDRCISGIGHRVVHGGLKLLEHQIITDPVMEKLRQAKLLDSAHLPREISLIETFAGHFQGVPQVACFDTAFFKDLPTLAKLLPVPRKYFDQGIHRLGFHGLSYTYLMQELARVAGETACKGKIILAHLGSGASMAAIKNGKPIDTTMGFTPVAGLMMGTRPGDLDPGFLVYLLRSEKLSADQLDDLLNKQCGLKGVSGTSSDMRDLVDHAGTDPHAKEAVDLFCQQAKKWIGSYAAVLGGIDTLVFAGGIGEHSAAARAGICEGLNFLGIDIDPELNAKSGSIISKGKVTVRVIATDEEIIIAQTVLRLSTLAGAEITHTSPSLEK